MSSGNAKRRSCGSKILRQTAREVHRNDEQDSELRRGTGLVFAFRRLVFAVVFGSPYFVSPALCLFFCLFAGVVSPCFCSPVFLRILFSPFVCSPSVVSPVLFFGRCFVRRFRFRVFLYAGVCSQLFRRSSSPPYFVSPALFLVV